MATFFIKDKVNIIKRLFKAGKRVFEGSETMFRATEQINRPNDKTYT